jgi:superfamily II DNA or RNA helicase
MDVAFEFMRQSALAKLAAVRSTLEPHQQRVVDRIQDPDQPGLVVAHGTGTGKTLSSIAAIDALGMPADAVVPAALQDNYKKELDKHLEPGSARPDVHSLAVAGRTGGAAELMADRPAGQPRALVVDEAHRLRNPNSIGYDEMRQLGAGAAKRLYLSASPVYNHPVDIAPLVNLAANKHVLPETQAAFAHDYLHTRKVEPGLFAGLAGVQAGEVDELDPRKSGALASKLRKWVDYHQNPTDNADFPQRHDETIDVPVSDEQRKVYDTLLGKAPWWVRYKVQHGLPPSKQEASDLNAFSSGARQSLLSPHVFSQGMGLADHATKQRMAVDRLEAGIAANKRHKAVVYSPYLGAGLDPYAKLLEERGIPFGRFTGDVPKEVRDQAVRDYNENKLRALLVSDAGSEGLDLKGTRAIQILAPAWNQERLNQIIGRGIRYKSHADLPEAERHVNIENYRSVLPQSTLARLFRMKPDTSVDQYMDQVTANKERLNAQLRDVMARGGIGGPEDERRAAELNREDAHREAMQAWTRSQAT